MNKENKRYLPKSILLCSLIGIISFSSTGCAFTDKLFKRPGTVDKVVVDMLDDEEKFNDIIQNPNVSENKEFVFEEKKVKEKPVPAKPAETTKKVILYLGDNVYYPIIVPFDLEIITDNSKYVYAKDSSVNVSVVSNVPWDNFSKFVSIDKAMSIQPSLIRTADGVKGPQEAAKHIANDKAVIVRTYDNSVAFETIFKGLEENTYKVSNYGGMNVEKDETEILKSFPLITGYHVSVTAGLGDDVQKVYSFEDGSLTILREFKKFEDAIDTMGTKMAIVSNSNIADKILNTKSMYYVEKGDYTIGVVSVNYNTTLTLFGSGTEARFNIISFMQKQ